MTLRQKPVLVYLSVLSIVVLLGVYIGNLFFGTNSVRILWSLEATKEQLQKKVSALQQENALIQKEYFELKGLEPQ